MAINLLYSNDNKGAYPASWYAATANELPPFPEASDDLRADVCVIGGGYTGLSAALHLAEAGVDVALVDAHRVGFGASGRNGGQLGSGQRLEQDELEKTVGPDAARKLWELSEDAKQLVKELVARHRIDCDLKPGILHTGLKASEVREMHHYADHMADLIQDPCIVVGHSMGAMIAMELADRHGDSVRGMAALNAIYRRDATDRKAVEARADALDGKPSAAPSMDDGRRSLEFVTAVYASARNGQPTPQ